MQTELHSPGLAPSLVLGQSAKLGNGRGNGRWNSARVWIDLANSPHPLLFSPIARALEGAGHEVLVTVRDHAQTVELTSQGFDAFEVIGRASPRARAAKASVIADRTMSLAFWARRRRPDVALSHNSYAQILAARAIGVPAVTAMDYEGQPVNHLAFRLASLVLIPDPLPLDVVRRQGAAPAKTMRYPGLKESLYLGDFTPDATVASNLGLGPGNARVTVVARTPPSRAVYHRFGNPLFEEALRTVCGQPDVRCVVLPRHDEQVAELKALDEPNLVVPDHAVDSRALMYSADLVLGAGGTMTREAALIGVPTYTVFAGETPAVDRWLEGRGLLRRLEDPGQLRGLEPRSAEPRSVDDLAESGVAARDAFVAATLSAAGVADAPPLWVSDLTTPRTEGVGAFAE